jgi:hypothetical protein
MQFENGADKQLYEEIQHMSPIQKQEVVDKVVQWYEDQQRVGFADGGAQPLRYLPLSAKPTPREEQIYNLLLRSPQVRPAGRRESTATAKNEAQATFTTLMKAPLHSWVKTHAMEYLPEGYGAIASQVQQSKSRFGDKKGGKSKKLRKRKSKKFIRK